VGDGVAPTSLSFIAPSVTACYRCSVYRNRLPLASLCRRNRDASCRIALPMQCKVLCLMQSFGVNVPVLKAKADKSAFALKSAVGHFTRVTLPYTFFVVAILAVTTVVMVVCT